MPTELLRRRLRILDIEGIHCDRCVHSVREALLDGRRVVNLAFSDNNRQIVVEFDPERIDEDELVLAVEQAGHREHHGYRARISRLAPAS